MKSKKLLVITGPTSTGKTDLAILLAKKFNGEIVSCDSRQVYKGLDIGTGKEPSLGKGIEVEKFQGYWVMDGVKVHMYDVVEPLTRYDVAQFISDAEKVIEKILEEGKLPILVGGTGFYIKGLIEGLSNLKFPVNEKLRGELEKLSLEELQERLRKKDLETFNKLNESDRANPRRLIRKIEILDNPEVIEESASREQYEVLKIGLTASREKLYEKSDVRVVKRIEQGMVGEAESLLEEKKITLERMRELGLEYGVLADLMESKISSLDEFALILQNKIHHYIKRQLTFFKTDKEIIWFDVTEKSFLDKVVKQVANWYN